MLVTFCIFWQPDQLVWLWIGSQKAAEEGWKTNEDMARYAKRRFGNDGCGPE